MKIKKHRCDDGRTVVLTRDEAESLFRLVRAGRRQLNADYQDGEPRDTGFALDFMRDLDV